MVGRMMLRSGGGGGTLVLLRCRGANTLIHSRRRRRLISVQQLLLRLGHLASNQLVLGGSGTSHIGRLHHLCCLSARRMCLWKTKSVTAN
jgi:hypothetical protein